MNAVAETRYLAARMTEVQLLDVLTSLAEQAETDEGARAIFAILDAALSRRLGLDATKVAAAPLGTVETLQLAFEAQRFWVLIDRQHNQDVAVGPFATKELAEHDLQYGKVIDDLCHEDCLDAYVFEGLPPVGFDRVKPQYLVFANSWLVRLQGVDE
ncbi:hypothetical protein V5R04_01565 [Jonesiaceae bacterium BS-20]|uniref:Uncharacterized protein n=1 Tax=Jonesiaceae bacterium BS-20 TaxID=3120821 RepID=A0AAU7DXB5_9MICO